MTFIYLGDEDDIRDQPVALGAGRHDADVGDVGVRGADPVLDRLDADLEAADLCAPDESRRSDGDS